MRHSMILALLGAGVWSCSSPWPWDAQPSQLQVRYAPARAYGDPSIRPVVVVDDGSGERVITAEELRTAPQAVAIRETRTSGTLHVRVHLLAPTGDTLAAATARLPLEPDLIWQVTVMPGLIVDETVVSQLDHRTHVAVPISPRGAIAAGDSLYVLWASTRRSVPSVS